jgi:hypothetical protein
LLFPLNVWRLMLPAILSAAALAIVPVGTGFADPVSSAREERGEQAGPIRFRIEPAPLTNDGGVISPDRPHLVADTRISALGTSGPARLDIDSGTGRVTNRLLAFVPEGSDDEWLWMPVGLDVSALEPPAADADTTDGDGDLVVGQTLADLAARQIGRRYRFGGSSPATGFDCSGLVQYVLRENGIAIGRDTNAQWRAGLEVSRDDLQPGDLVFFQNTYRRGLSHVGIYAGDGRFVDAVDERRGVKENALSNPYWDTRFYGARRVR